MYPFQVSLLAQALLCIEVADVSPRPLMQCWQLIYNCGRYGIWGLAVNMTVEINTMLCGHIEDYKNILVSLKRGSQTSSWLVGCSHKIQAHRGRNSEEDFSAFVKEYKRKEYRA